MGLPDLQKRVRKRIQRIRKARKQGRETLLGFLKAVWWKPWTLLVGRHTKAICERIDIAIADYFKGKSTFLLVAVHFRHGKSDISSRALPPFFLAKCKAAGMDPDIIMSGYGDTLIKGFSKDAQGIIQSPKFQAIFPDVKLSRYERAVHEWSIEGTTGRVYGIALGGGLMGKGGDLIILDDYCKNRDEARSETYREKTWARFQDLLSRRAPTSIFIIAATPWHIDDVRGRIKKAMEEDPDFPRFEELNFPAKNKDPKTGVWDGSFLFEGRFPKEWYRGQYSAQGTFAPALLDCDPVMEGGNLFDMTRLVYHDTLDDFPNAIELDDGTFSLRGYKRGWDLASTEKQRSKSDPDFTVGVKGFVKVTTQAVQGVELRAVDIWVADVVYLQAKAPNRDKTILDAVIRDGRSTSHSIEAFGAYKDAYETFKKLLRGVVLIEKSHMPGDKVAKASPMEEAFNAGRVHVLRAPWNAFWEKHFMQFPDGTHDDAVDATAVMFDAFMKNKAGIASPEFFRMLNGGQ